jgi:curved DNA-binding protein CbpA
MTFHELQQALTVFGLGERANLAMIRDRHRDLVRRHHPDCGAEDGEAIRRINSAYRILCDYCRAYRFSFDEEEFLAQQPEERLRRQFACDPIWGGVDPDR